MRFKKKQRNLPSQSHHVTSDEESYWSTSKPLGVLGPPKEGASQPGRTVKKLYFKLQW